MYILRCADGSLYTGVARDTERRLEEHNARKGAKYTRGRTPVSLIYRERCPDRSRAQKRELAIKRMPRSRKLRLVDGT